LKALVASGNEDGCLKHRLNNPLAALLAEAQMMELEPMTPEHANAVRRIVELCRRVINVADTIDGLGTQRAP
jgi:signal transduction histidine kinase